MPLTPADRPLQTTSTPGQVWHCCIDALAMVLDRHRREFGPVYGRNRPLRVVAASGYFNPPHVGHARYLRAAFELGDLLVAIVNSDRQVALKGSVPFMSERERLELVASLWGVHYAILACDEGPSVAETLMVLRPDVFAKGGDRSSPEVMDPGELRACEEIGCKVAYGVGGREKVQSSSRLIEAARRGPGV